MNEELSRLVDCELEDSECERALDRLVRNPDKQREWAAYHLIGDVMRGEVTQTGPNQADQIRLALEEEPTVLAPRVAVPRFKGLPSRSIVKPAAMFTIAASLSIIAILAFVPKHGRMPNESTSLGITSTGNQRIEKVNHEFDNMLVNHGEFTATSGLNGLVAYVKFVSRQEPRHYRR